jgi:predicted ATP-grasp superfamily ATP-dependent carboligase
MAAANDAIDISKLQKEIESYLNLGSTSVIFEFEGRDTKMRLNLVTVNPRHNQSFLFQSVEGYDKKDCLKKMWSYIKTSRDKENSYTIQWSIKGERELHTSYFRARDIQEAIDKLIYGRDPNALNIFSVVLNPIS